MDWDVFFDRDNIKLDVPNTPVIKMAQMLKSQGFDIVIFSGRSKVSYRTTRQWLIQNDVPFDDLHMRPTDDYHHYMKDSDLKQMWLDTLINKDDVFVYNGWMFSSSPSITPFDHPVYDIWLVSCY